MNPASDNPVPVRPPLEDVAVTCARLGLTSFGGPIAHIAYLRDACVVRRRWVDERTFADVIALCQFLPGPASSQAVFALGMLRAGWPGAILASFLFLAPSAAIMIALAYHAAATPELAASPWVHGLKLAAVAVVLHAVWSMARTLCPDMARSAIAALTAVLCLLVPGAIANVAGIVVGLVIGRVILARRPDLATLDSSGAGPANESLDVGPRRMVSRRMGTLLLLAWALLLAASFAMAPITRLPAQVQQSAAMYRAGSLVFGGGHVVLPLLREQTVTRGWITDDAFLTGYAGAQTVPGPLFSFAAYLGAAMRGESAPLPRWANAVGCVVAIFLPGWLLVVGAMPFWHRLRAMPGAVGTLRGANAAVVGVLFAAWIDPVASSTIRTSWGPGLLDAAIALAAFGALAWWRAPAWSVVLACAGVAWLAAAF